MENNQQEEYEEYNDYDEYDFGFEFNETNDGYSENGLPIMDLRMF